MAKISTLRFLRPALNFCNVSDKTPTSRIILTPSKAWYQSYHQREPPKDSSTPPLRCTTSKSLVDHWETQMLLTLSALYATSCSLNSSRRTTINSEDRICGSFMGSTRQVRAASFQSATRPQHPPRPTRLRTSSTTCSRAAGITPAWSTLQTLSS